DPKSTSVGTTEPLLVVTLWATFRKVVPPAVLATWNGTTNAVLFVPAGKSVGLLVNATIVSVPLVLSRLMVGGLLHELAGAVVSKDPRTIPLPLLGTDSFVGSQVMAT